MNRKLILDWLVLILVALICCLILQASIAP